MSQISHNPDAGRGKDIKSELRYTFIAGLVAIPFFAMSGYLLSKTFERDTLTLALDAPGCVSTTPRGGSLEQALAEGLKTIPKGTTFTAICFERKR